MTIDLDRSTTSRSEHGSLLPYWLIDEVNMEIDSNKQLKIKINYHDWQPTNN